jgi:hypothetical protein
MGIISKWLRVALICAATAGCVSAEGKGQPPAFARRLGYAGCQISGPFVSEEEVVKKGLLEGEQVPDWERMKGMMRSGDAIYHFQCISAGRDRVATGSTFFGLVRDFTVVGVFDETILD